MVLEKIHSKNNVLFFSILSLVSNIAIILSILTVNYYAKGVTDNLNAQFSEQEKIMNDQSRFYIGRSQTIAQRPSNVKVNIKVNTGFNIVASLIYVLFLVMNLFLFLGIKNGKPKFIKAWIVFRLVLAGLMVIGALIYTIVLPISMSSIISGWFVLPPIILIYCLIGFYLFEVSTVYVYLKELRNEILNIHLKPRHAGTDFI